MLSNINLSDTNHLFKYVVEILDGGTSNISTTYYYNAQFSESNQRITFYNEGEYIREGDVWTNNPQYISKPSQLYIPTHVCEHTPIDDDEVTNLYNINIGGTEQWVNDTYINTTSQYKILNGVINLPCGDKLLSGQEINYIYKNYKTYPYQYDLFRYNISKLRIYFPNFSIDTYNKGVKYALDIYIWIGGSRVDLGTFIFNRSEALACPDIKLFGDIYSEYLEFSIINPRDLLYSDSWKDFREKVCNEVSDINITESPIYISLYPVKPYNTEYMIMDDYDGGQNSIRLSDELLSLHLTSSPEILNTLTEYEVDKYWKIVNNYNYILTNISSNSISETDIDDWYRHQITPQKFIDNPDSIIEILTTEDINNLWNNKYVDSWEQYIYNYIKYNTYYDSLEEYIQETYNLNGNITILYELALRDNDNIYWYVKSEDNIINKYIFNNFPKDIFNWDWYKQYINTHQQNLYFQSIATILSDNQPIIYLRSNELLVTQELFKYLVYNPIKIVNANMNIYNLNIINKTINEIIQMDNPSDSKSNIIQPVFFRAKEGPNITVHPRFTENICINLNQFKAKVDRFILQIENTNFVEIGRIASGVIFKIIGTSLPGDLTEGTYYILNEDGEGITTGQYKYE